MPNKEHEFVFDASGFLETSSVMNELMQYTTIAQSCESTTLEDKTNTLTV
ncbi:hypothetical protein NBO_35g0001 [Nosema bombycis CQ1]|uniref:Uncharacterized protein n=1 Tax=Nosema bombycis (strain CQ1 / CVCC 102059) TaxID=578461 RepID=R0KV98_NOSB1|nr:hypothetical protein NBO_35g0001 [Nosema bombycis CQ1]|eukprot:EOB14147.1 hypothetical protein NBO_35g0001 [Nosema bombycis CQ1]